LIVVWEIKYFYLKIKVKRKTYGEACTAADVDTTVGLTCGSSGYAICSGSLFWNSTYCGLLFN